MVEDGPWLSRTPRRRFHQTRLRRERLGELLQTDGSEHRRFKDRASAWALPVFSLLSWEYNRETAPLTRFAFDPKPSAMTANDVLDDSQSESSSADLP